MNGKAEKIIREKSEDFVLWTGAYRSFLEMSLDAVYYSEEECVSIWNDLELLYMEIFDTLFEINSFRDTWNGPHVMPLAVPRGLEGSQEPVQDKLRIMEKRIEITGNIELVQIPPCFTIFL